MEQRGIFSCLSAALAPEIIYYLSDIIVFGISLHKYSYSHHSDRTNYRQCYNRILQRIPSRLFLACILLHDLQLCHRGHLESHRRRRRLERRRARKKIVDVEKINTLSKNLFFFFPGKVIYRSGSSLPNLG